MTKEEGPSFRNALKWTLYRDQRIISYIVGLLIIPINIIHGNWHHLFDEELELDSVKFEEIVDPTSAWRQEHSQASIINNLLKLTTYDEYQYFLMSIFLFFVIFRMLNMLSYFSSMVEMNLNLLYKIFNFLTTYILTLAFVFLAWSMCQHILFGANLKAYSDTFQSFISTMMLALRHFKFVDQMYDTEPNVTLILFVFFIIAVSYFLADIFISLVILIYNEVIKMNL